MGNEWERKDASVGSKEVVAVVLAAVQLMTRKPRTKREIAELLGCSVPTAGKYVDLMVEEGLVEELGKETKRRRPDGTLPDGPCAVVYGWVKVDAEC